MTEAVGDVISRCSDSFVGYSNLVTVNISARIELAKLIDHGIQQDMVGDTGV